MNWYCVYKSKEKGCFFKRRFPNEKSLLAQGFKSANFRPRSSLPCSRTFLTGFGHFHGSKQSGLVNISVWMGTGVSNMAWSYQLVFFCPRLGHLVPAPELQLPTETIPLKLVFQISRNQIKDSVQSKNFKASSGVLSPDLTNLKHDAQPLDTHDSTQAADSKPGGGFDFQASGFILCLPTSEECFLRPRIVTYVMLPSFFIWG